MGLFGKKKKDDIDPIGASQHSGEPSAQTSELTESKVSTTSTKSKKKGTKEDAIYRDSVVTNAYESSLPTIMQPDFMKNLNPLADIGEYTEQICKNNA